MKHHLNTATAAAALVIGHWSLVILLLFPQQVFATNPTLTQAQLTLIIKDVKTIDPAKGARPSVIRETVQGRQGVRTGIDSRTELLFNDNTITRLGSNTHFSFTEGTRDMTLQSGVMLLQVPKGIGGATIETPAVTAGITGTTIMLEQSVKFTKLIVLEGDCWLVAKLKNGKVSRRVWARAGEEIIFPNGAAAIPPPVFINLKLLESTSLLLTGKWGAHLNYGPIVAAANGQKPGQYVPIGAYVTDTTGKLPPTITIQNPQVAPTPPPQPTPPPHNIIR